MRTTTTTALLLAGALLVGACSATDDAPTAAGTDADVAGDHVVDVTSDEFGPESLNVAVGETVTWRFVEGTHNVVFDDDESDVLSSGTWQRTFDATGTFDYECTLHRGMTGTVVVS